MAQDPLSATIERDFAELLSVLREMRAVGARTLEAYDGRRHNVEEHNFILFLARATECLGAMECLFVNGWENDATCLVRTLADLYIEVLYIGTDRAALLARYSQFGVVADLRHKERMARVLQKTVDDLLRMEYAHVRGMIDPSIPSAEAYLAAYQQEVAEVTGRWGFREKQD